MSHLEPKPKYNLPAHRFDLPCGDSVHTVTVDDGGRVNFPSHSRAEMDAGVALGVMGGRPAGCAALLHELRVYHARADGIAYDETAHETGPVLDFLATTAEISSERHMNRWPERIGDSQLLREALSGSRNTQEAWAALDRGGRNRHLQIAQLRAAQRLWQSTGTLGQIHYQSDNKIRIRHDVLTLRYDWHKRVYLRGLAVVDGHFVAHVRKECRDYASLSLVSKDLPLRFIRRTIPWKPRAR